MRHLQSLPVVSLLFTTAACTPSAVRAPTRDYGTVVDTVKAGMLSYANALNALDSGRVLGHYVAGPEFRLVSDGNTYSYADMQEVIGDSRNSFQAMGVTWDTLLVTPLSPDAAFV